MQTSVQPLGKSEPPVVEQNKFTLAFKKTESEDAYLKERARNISRRTRCIQGLYTAWFLISVVLAISGSKPSIQVAILAALGIQFTIVGISCTSFGRKNVEHLAAVSFLIFLVGRAIANGLIWQPAATELSRSVCENLEQNVSAPLLLESQESGDSTWSATMSLCSRVQHEIIQAAYWNPFGIWLVFAMMPVLLLRMRFIHSVSTAGISAIVEMSLGLVQLGPHHSSGHSYLVANWILSYIPGLCMVLILPRIFERRDRQHFITRRANIESIKERDNVIRKKDAEIKSKDKQLNEARDLVRNTMASADNQLRPFAINFGDIEMGEKLGEGSTCPYLCSRPTQICTRSYHP